MKKLLFLAIATCMTTGNIFAMNNNASQISVRRQQLRQAMITFNGTSNEQGILPVQTLGEARLTLAQQKSAAMAALFENTGTTRTPAQYHNEINSMLATPNVYMARSLLSKWVDQCLQNPTSPESVNNIDNIITLNARVQTLARNTIVGQRGFGIFASLNENVNKLIAEASALNNNNANTNNNVDSE